MSVVDASVFVDALISTGDSGTMARQALRRLPRLEVPAIFPAEVTSAVRRRVLAGVLSEPAAHGALVALADVDRVGHSFDPFLERVWELRHHLTPYDAWYVALAESLDTPLLTTDSRIVGAPGLRCEIQVIGRGGSSG